MVSIYSVIRGKTACHGRRETKNPARSSPGMGDCRNPRQQCPAAVAGAVPGAGREAGVSEADINDPSGWIAPGVLERMLRMALCLRPDPVPGLRLVAGHEPRLQGGS
jgi:hypothetical protein